MVNYNGHGGIYGWANEQVLTTDDIDNFYNTRLPLWVTATCDFSRFDNFLVSAGEKLLTNPKGGAMGLVSTTRTVLQDINYKFDDAGNILSITQQASAVNGTLGGVYTNDYHYDKQYRLIQSDGNGGFAYTFKARYSPSGRMSSKSMTANNLVGNLRFGYDNNFYQH